MKMIIAGLFATAVLATPLVAGELKAVEPHACAPSLEKWGQVHGHKTADTPGLDVTIRVTWTSGSINDVRLGWARDPVTARPAICVIYNRNIVPGA